MEIEKVNEFPQGGTAAGLKGRSLISLRDYTPEEIAVFLAASRYLKEEHRAGIVQPLLAGKSLGMLFAKSSTRTRVSFQVGMYQLGGTALFLSPQDLQLGRGETISDTAAVLSRYLDAIMARTFAHSDLIELAEAATIPVINGLTDFLHPCQALADYFTIWEHKKSLKGRKLAYVGDGNNVAHSLIFGAARLGVNMVLACPPGYEPDEEVVAQATEEARSQGAVIEVINDPVEAVSGADVIYTDVWASMGQEAEEETRRRAFRRYQVNRELVSRGKADVVVMHCLPAHRGAEITDEVMDGPHSIVFEQAENRLHCQKAVLALLLQN